MTDNRFSFTRGKLRDLPSPRVGWKYFYDDRERGLGIGVGATGTKSFLVYRKFKGRPIRVTLGVFDSEIPETRELPEGAKPLDLLGHRASLNVRMARKVARAVTAQLDTGVNPADELSEDRKTITLGTLFSRYIAARRAEGRKTIPALTWIWERYLGKLPDKPRRPYGAQRTKANGSVNWEHRRLSEITYQRVSALRRDIGENIGHTTANRVLELLCAMYNFARKEKLYKGENPAADVDQFPERPRKQFLKSHEVPPFLAALDSQPDGTFRDFVLLSIFIGARRGNILRMRWEDLSLDGKTWTLPGDQMKNNDDITIPLVDEAIEILRRRASDKANGEWVFPGDSNTGCMGPPRKQWAKLVKAAGLRDLRMHDLRRTCASWMTNTGASPLMTMAALGHKSIAAAMGYQRAENRPVADAMQRGITAFLEARKEKGGHLRRAIRST